MSDEVVVKKKRVQVLTPEQVARRSALQRVRRAGLTPEQVAEAAKRSRAAYALRPPERRCPPRVKTPEQKARIRELAKVTRDSLTPEQKAIHAERKKAARLILPLTAEQKARRSEQARARYASFTPAKRAENALACKVRKSSLTAEQRLKYASTAEAYLTPDRRARNAASMRDRWASLTLEQLAHVRELARLRARLNPEKVVANYQNARAKRSRAEGTHTHLDIKALFASQRGTCPNCQALLIKRGPGKYHVDHIMPIALGGSNWPDNLQLLCPDCNRGKGSKHPDVWMAYNLRKRAVDFIPF